MSNESIPLAKGNNPGKRKYPGFLSLKLDGCPARVDVVFANGTPQSYSIRTRQHEEVLSCDRQVRDFLQTVCDTGLSVDGAHTFVFEVTHKKLKNFKDVSGVFRRQSQQEDLVLNLFDYTSHQFPDAAFMLRTSTMTELFQHFQSPDFKMIHQYAVQNEEEFQRVQAALLERFPNAEGLVYRSADALWAPGTRRWDYQKILNEPTVDLKIVGFEEAKCGKTGAGKGMAGRLVAEYKGKEIGVGPGKLTHDERKELWELYLAKKGTGPEGSEWPRRANLIATIKYKRDPSYEALRQPTFQHWRPEKEEPSYE